MKQTNTKNAQAKFGHEWLMLAYDAISANMLPHKLSAKSNLTMPNLNESIASFVCQNTRAIVYFYIGKS
jgi:hypothetical protein